jgi:uncharacterized phage protein gp47/JayE
VPYPRPTLTALRTQAMQDITASDLPNADGFLRRAVLRVLAWVQAGLAYLHYGYLDWISRQSTPSTSTGEYLEGWAALAPTPVLREAPTFASGPATWSGTVTTPLPSGTVCSRDDGVQFATAADAVVGGGGTVTVTVIALVAGSNGNTDSGAPLTLAVTIDGIGSAGSASGPIVGGADLELDGPMRSRMEESYGAPPHGGNTADYQTWALQVEIVRDRELIAGRSGIAGLQSGDAIRSLREPAIGRFRLVHHEVDGNGAQARAVRHPCPGDAGYPLRPVTPIVYAMAPQAATEAFTIAGLSGISTAQQAQVSAALTTLLVQDDSPLANTSIEQSDCAAAITAIGGLPSFAITTPSSWPITSSAGYIFVLGTVTYT